MRVPTLSWPTLVGLVILSLAGASPALLAQTAPPKAAAATKVAASAAGSATGSLTVAGKSAALTHAVAFKAGARIYLLITDQVLPPNETKSEFELAKYQFLHKVVGLELTLDHTRRVTETAYRWELAKTVCEGCFEVSLAGGPDGPLTGTVKTTAKGEAQKLKADVTFSAPFAKPSSAKP
jgi:hypothetical protein